MMKTACFLVALALCAATAPPRISLELGDDANRQMPSHFPDATGGTAKAQANSADYSEACEVNSIATECAFPHAKGWDMNDREVTVTTSIKTVNAEGEIVATEYSNANADFYQSAANAEGILNKTGSYLFQYTAKDNENHDATQVNFFLLVNDVEPPKCNTTCLEQGFLLNGTGCQTADVTALDECIAEVKDSCSDNSLRNNNITFTDAITYTGDLSEKNLSAVLTITAKDDAGLYGRNGANNVNERTYSFLVTDVTPPLLEDVNTVVVLECDLTGNKHGQVDTINNAKITCNDTCSNVSPTLTVIPAYSSLNASLVGDVNISLSCIDNYGNAATKQQRFETVDTVDPVIVFNYTGSTVKFPIIPANGSVTDFLAFHEEAKYSCDERQDTSCHIDYLAYGERNALRTMLTVTDDCCINDEYAITAVWDSSNGSDDEYPATHVKNGTILPDFTAVGKYNRTFTATDCSNNSASYSITVELEDPNAPVVNPVGCNESSKVAASCTYTVEASTTGTFIDEGAKCLDYVDGDLSARVEVSGDIVNLAVVGEYTISYSCTDYGSQEGTATRTVYVQDTTPPVLRFGEGQGKGFLVHEAGEAYTDEGCTMSDSLDGECVFGVDDCSIVMHGDTVNDNQAYFAKSSCNSIYTNATSADKKDGMYVISPATETGNLKRQTVACAFPVDGDAVAITAQIVTVDSSKTLAAADSYCKTEFASAAMALTTTRLDASQMTALNLVLDTENHVFHAPDDQELGNFVCYFTGGPDGDQVDSKKQHHVAHVGVWVIKYVGTDSASLIGTLHRTVMVKDTMPPIISLVSESKVDAYNTATSETTSHSALISALNVSNDAIRTTTDKHLFYTKMPAELMAQTSVNGYFMCAIASAVAGVALLGFSAKKSQTMVPV